jgi:hypothetical protein
MENMVSHWRMNVDHRLCLVRIIGVNGALITVCIAPEILDGGVNISYLREDHARTAVGGSGRMEDGERDCRALRDEHDRRR